MLRYTSYKRTFIIAAMVILLCLTCLVGATLAIFTESTDPGTIAVITTAGDVDIDIVDINDTTSLTGKKLQFMMTSEELKEDQDILFEPGAVFYTQGFRVKNNGTIPVKFNIKISDTIVDSDAAKAPELAVKFEDAFDIWITTTPSGEPPENVGALFSGKVGGKDISDTYFLVIRMKESAKDEFQGKKFEQISFTVTATQQNAPID